MAITHTNATKKAFSTSYVDLYTAPSATTGVVIGLTICNVTAAAHQIYLQHLVASDPTIILNGVTVNAGETLMPLDRGTRITLKASEKLQVKADASTCFEVFAAIDEVT